jgi:hypothetical protein
MLLNLLRGRKGKKKKKKGYWGEDNLIVGKVIL